MAVCTGLWYHAEMNSQQRGQIEQFSRSLQLGLAPLLKSRDAELVRAQLNHIRYSSTLPLTAIVIYDSQQRILAGSDTNDALRAYIPDVAVSEFLIQRHGRHLLAVTPLPDMATGAIPPAANSSKNEAYLLLVIQNDLVHSVWLVPMLLVAIIGILVLRVLQHNLQQASSRLHSDISLITHKLSQLQQGQHSIHLNEELVAELYPLKQAVNDLAAHQLTMHHNTQLAQQQLHDTARQDTALLQQLNQQYEAVQHNYQRLQQLVQQRLSNLRQLSDNGSGLEHEQLQRALSDIVQLWSLEHSSEQPEYQNINLSELVANVVQNVQPVLAGYQTELQIIEGEGIAVSQASLPLLQVQLMLQALLQLCARVSAASELVLRLQVRTDDTSQLEISVTGNGNGIPARVVQLLQSTDTRALQWHETDIGCVIAITQKCAAKLSVQSLEGLGSTVNVALPLTVQDSACQSFQQILLFDQSTLLSERKRSLNRLTQHVITCADIAELERKMQLHSEIALVFLPEPADLVRWQPLLQQLAKRSRCLFFAKAAELAIWRETLQFPVFSPPFYLALLLKLPNATELPRLLVVDDNPTNLAFVQVLLKSQPLQLTLASSGVEALQLCQQQRFDLVLLDIQLPDLAGTDVAIQLRQLAGYQEIPILAFTAHALDDEVTAFKRAGMNDVILKPLDASKLEQILFWCSKVKINHISE